MKYSFHPDAEIEFVQAIEYYEKYEEGLGYDFAVEVYSAVERITSYPMPVPQLYPIAQVELVFAVGGSFATPPAVPAARR